MAYGGMIMGRRNLERGALAAFSVSKQQEVVVFDVETTGLGKDAKIIQFSAVKYNVVNGLLQEKSYVDVYINPKEPLSPKITEITGICDELLSYYDGEEVTGPKILEYMKDVPLWLGYNVGFDVRMLSQMAERLNIPFVANETADVLEMARDFSETESHKLCDVYNNYFTDSVQFHSAIDDVRATGKLANVFLPKYAKTVIQNCEQVHLEWASYFVNPHRQSQKRIKINIDKDKSRYGWIYWDVVKHCWDASSEPMAKNLLRRLDINNLEQQMIAMYGERYNASNMDDLGRNWSKA